MSVRILTGDCREMLRTLSDESVHCCVTSPPYWGLRCYGVDGQLGQEPTYQEHIAVMVDVFREVRRVLRKDGTLWLNYGDSYASSVNGRPAADIVNDDRTFRDKPFSTIQGILKPKDLCGIPWRIAFALQADGWWLRQDIVWSKPNPMPESVTDRCTKSHEYIFLLTKAERYYYDAEAIKEDVTENAHSRGHGMNPKRLHGVPGMMRSNPTFTANELVDCRNKRSVWEIATAPFSEAHFATFPPALIEPCIKAGTSEKGCCAACGAPWVRQTERGATRDVAASDLDRYGNGDAGVHRKIGGQYQKWLDENPVRTIGWLASCKCDPNYVPDRPPVPCTVLDPFGGAGTTGLVADRLQRNAVLIELNPAYAEMARRRIDGDAPLFSQSWNEAAE